MARDLDGTIIDGGFTITIGSPGVEVIVNSYSINRPRNEIIQTDENDEPNAAIRSNGQVTGSANIQVSQTSEQADFRGEEFTTAAMTGTSEAFQVLDSNPGGSKNGLTTQDITFSKVLNPA